MMRPLLIVTALLAMVTPLVQAQGKREKITEDEILKAVGKGATAFDAVRSLRPRWLDTRDSRQDTPMESRDPPRGAGPQVYMDDRRAGDLDYLRTIPAERVKEIRWVSATEAGARFGPTPYPGIVVILKPAGT